MATITKLGLHEAQREIFYNPARHQLVVASRRFGKTRLLLTKTITKALTFNQPYDELSPPVITLGANTLKQCTALFWGPLVSFFENQPYVKQINKQDKSIHFYDKPSILLRGFDNDGDSFRGLKIYFCGIDEVQQINKSVLDEAIVPALADTLNSSSLLIGTPKGTANIAYKLSQEYQERKDAAFFKKTVYDNPHFPREEIEKLKSNLSERTFRQELLAEFVDFPGKIFTEFDENSNLFSFDSSSEDLKHLYVAIDPGINNAALVLFSATQDLQFKVIKTIYSNETLTVNDLISRVGELQNIAGELGSGLTRIYVPDDRRDIVYSLRQNGFKQSIVVARSNPGPNVRAELLNNLFKQDRILIERRETGFIEEIQSYHRATDGNGEVVDKIADGQKDHRIDAISYGVARICYQNKQLFRDLTLAKNAISSDINS